MPDALIEKPNKPDKLEKPNQTKQVKSNPMEYSTIKQRPQRPF
jgi:hypothetical protein